ncbi:hypothetical protein A2876_04765 [Candidatus Amesbacteria bacterium RIFCSPHIGHO2_01_FULL_48_32b]|uniref:LytR/CpsA/Psr regulator C-terminal domain-containing protein n=1 Tax=Candidatus Amesbacteria bacterium RIFCSPHIGHO2_01_FULL_48_32b TaxID=1797253 RepID=A0A1F4YGR6_9BACT|nr:MAG: hypothetical protein A2876_04765 [Candidatus Amesbacteria bacterium RIFCSPHIGHO2_01_FULL_48_32b]
MGVMPAMKKKTSEEPVVEEKPKVMLEAAVEAEPSGVVEPVSESISATVGDLARIQETPKAGPTIESVPAEISGSVPTTMPTMPVEVTAVTSSGGGWMWGWAVISLLLGLVLGGGVGYMVWGRDKNLDKKMVTSELAAPESGVTEVSGPTPTIPVVEVKREDVKLQVLNGSGVVGAASVEAKRMEGLGYKDVKTGNADRDDYQETSISVKSGKAAVWELVKGDLEGKYEVSTTSGSLDKGSEFDAVVILGSK